MTVVAPRAGALRHIGDEIESYDLFHYGEGWRWRLGLRQNAGRAIPLLFPCWGAKNSAAEVRPIDMQVPAL